MLRLFLGSALVYVLCAAGYVDTMDADPSLATARALVDEGTFAVEPGPFRPPRGVGGRAFTKLGLLHPLLYAPLLVAARAVAPLVGWDPEPLWRFLVSLVNPLLTAALVALLFRLLVGEGVERRKALGLALVAGFATYLLPYSKTVHREPLHALIVLAAYSLGPWGAGAAAGLAPLTKHALIVPVLPALALAAHRAWRGDRRGLLAIGLPALFGWVLWGLFAWYAFGSPFATGYEPQVVSPTGTAWSTPFWLGIHEQLFSLHTGLFFYSPVLCLLPPALFRAREWRSLDTAIAASVVLQVALYARWASSTGHESLGPRYLVVVTPLLVCWLRHGEPLRGWLPKGVLLWSLAVQAASTAVKIQQYYTLQDRARTHLTRPHWAANFVFLAHKLRGKPEVYRLRPFRPGIRHDRRVDLSRWPSLRGLNFWWLHALRTSRASSGTPPRKEPGHRWRGG